MNSNEFTMPRCHSGDFFSGSHSERLVATPLALVWSTNAGKCTTGADASACVCARTREETVPGGRDGISGAANSQHGSLEGQATRRSSHSNWCAMIDAIGRSSEPMLAKECLEPRSGGKCMQGIQLHAGNSIACREFNCMQRIQLREETSFGALRVAAFRSRINAAMEPI